MADKKKQVTEATKKAFLQAMVKSFGNVTASCRAVGIDRSTPYQWADKDPEFKEKFNSNMYEETFLDAIEAKLAKLAMDENPTVLIFLAKTKGKKRGYVERNETDLTTGGKEIKIVLPSAD
ncbi:MAG: Cro/CI family transcriptional regulator [Methanoregula sp.]|jgi:hypothetical protein|nr:Cro/CI family transcriptional regulator [Methanoregula sp.]